MKFLVGVWWGKAHAEGMLESSCLIMHLYVPGGACNWVCMKYADQLL